MTYKPNAPLPSGTYRAINSTAVKDIGGTAMDATVHATPIGTFDV